MKNKKEAKSKSAYESERIEEFEGNKLNFMSMVAFLEEDEEKLRRKRGSVLKENIDLVDSNIKLEATISTLKFDLNKTNLSLQYII